MSRTTKKTTAPPARVLIVDDHPPVREALGIRIAQSPDLEVCGETGDVVEALQLFQKLQPDVGIIDISLKNGDGLDLIKRLRARGEKARLLVWSMYNEGLFAERALRAGAQGYLTKEHASDQIVVAIRQILAGKIYLSPIMTEKLLTRTIGESQVNLGRSPVDNLSDREMEVFRLIGQGIKITEIAAQLHLSVKTVETYRDRIRAKLDLEDSLELTREALRWILDNG